jgi:hypothetical protein
MSSSGGDPVREVREVRDRPSPSTALSLTRAPFVNLGHSRYGQEVAGEGSGNGDGRSRTSRTPRTRRATDRGGPGRTRASGTMAVDGTSSAGGREQEKPAGRPPGGLPGPEHGVPAGFSSALPPVAPPHARVRNADSRLSDAGVPRPAWRRPPGDVCGQAKAAAATGEASDGYPPTPEVAAGWRTGAYLASVARAPGAGRDTARRGAPRDAPAMVTAPHPDPCGPVSSKPSACSYLGVSRTARCLTAGARTEA